MFFFVLLFALEATGVHIISTSADQCLQRHLPFPARCASGCPSRFDKAYCVNYALKSLSHLSDDEIIVYADNDVLFSNWTESNFTQVLERFGNDKIVFNAQKNAYPMFYHRNTVKEKPNELNSGVFFGQKKLVMSFLDDVEKIIREFQHFQLKDKKTDRVDINYFIKASNDQDIDREVAMTTIDLGKRKLGPREKDGPGSDICIWKKKKPCNEVLQCRGCNINLTFYRHPNGVFLEARDPFIVHFAARVFHKDLFKKHLLEQQSVCHSPHLFEHIPVPLYDGPPTPLIAESSEFLLKRVGRNGRDF